VLARRFIRHVVRIGRGGTEQLRQAWRVSRRCTGRRTDRVAVRTRGASVSGGHRFDQRTGARGAALVIVVVRCRSARQRVELCDPRDGTIATVRPTRSMLRFTRQVAPRVGQLRRCLAADGGLARHAGRDRAVAHDAIRTEATVVLVRARGGRVQSAGAGSGSGSRWCGSAVGEAGVRPAASAVVDHVRFAGVGEHCSLGAAGAHCAGRSIDTGAALPTGQRSVGCVGLARLHVGSLLSRARLDPRRTAVLPRHHRATGG
jgi:hypothetical protein